LTDGSGRRNAPSSRDSIGGLLSDDGEYEWFTTVRATHVLRLVELLGGDPDSDVLDLLAQRYSGIGSYELERVIRESDIPVERFVR
jgi:hypothetical protein